MNEVLYDVNSGVAVVTFNAPERRNAFTPPMVKELLGACDRADADSSVGAVVIRSEGESFCAGGTSRHSGSGWPRPRQR
jgi:enoyl-CoA hydratase